MEKMTRERMRSMTPAEFDQIPEWPETIGTSSAAQWYDEDETPGCIDATGQRWKFRRDDAGKLHKQRVPRRAL